MNKYITPGVLSSMFGLAAWYESLKGHPAFGEWLGDPRTATAVYAVLGTVATLAAGAMRGVQIDEKK